MFRDLPDLALIDGHCEADRGRFCLLFSMNGHLESLGDMMMRDMYTFWPTYVPVIIFALIYLFSSWFIIILIPLHKAGDWLIFSRSITGWPTFSLSSWFGIPGNFKLMKNVIGFHAAACRCFAHIWSMVHHFFTFYLAHYVLIYLIYRFIFFGMYTLSSRNFGSR